MRLSSNYPLEGVGAPFMLPGFDTYKYKMHDPEDYMSIQYSKKFKEHASVSKKQINKQLTELVYHQISDRLKETPITEGLPKVFEENEALWSAQIMKNKKI